MHSQREKLAMRNVSYFPVYKTEENVVTNSVLLMLSHINRILPRGLERVLTGLFDDSTAVSVGPRFQSQIFSKTKLGENSIVDGRISQQDFALSIETKLGNVLDKEQIQRHLDAIADDSKTGSRETLLCLTGTRPPEEFLRDLEKLADKRTVNIAFKTFVDLVNAIESIRDPHRDELNEVVDEFRQFLSERGLLPSGVAELLVNPCGLSYENNVKFGIYHDQPERSKTFCEYLGLYRNKSVSHIGALRKVILVEMKDGDLVSEEELILPWTAQKSSPLAPEERDRIRGIVAHTGYYDLRSGFIRFYVVDEFVETSFTKTSKNGIQGHRYFTLGGNGGIIKDIFNKATNPSTVEVADHLRSVSWK